nr:immunoglobulin heavy chain junction region [Macaca mulatta]MOX66027.1 immunoglobulin heavy chain junction region [Macaca mulatta]MOX66531.1 immunoglobulin heavy chain junction region [Macaca mulatta]MOX66672.1 immunoglobulin heavy chain junction region [Macaca mulatta]MOX68365.1 immunoglobulin heavy chain junction region [Macaca mulatta]
CARVDYSGNYYFHRFDVW